MNVLFAKRSTFKEKASDQSEWNLSNFFLYSIFLLININLIKRLEIILIIAKQKVIIPLRLDHLSRTDKISKFKIQ
jgi:hypothetical protein